MKFHGGVNGGLLLLSLPYGGAWIEIRAGRSVGCEVIVAHREGERGWKFNVRRQDLLGAEKIRMILMQREHKVNTRFVADIYA